MCVYVCVQAAVSSLLNMLLLNTYIVHLDTTMFTWNVTPTGDLSRRNIPDPIDIAVANKTQNLAYNLFNSITFP